MNEPLRTITAYAQLVKARLHDKENPETLSLLNAIAEGALKIRSFMDALLQYSQAAAGISKNEPVDCEKMLSNVRASLDSAITDSGAVITHDPLPTVIANEQLECVFQNLLSNAIKYAKPEEAPEIEVSARQDSKGWIFSVRDNGIGIAPEYLDKVFDIFNRLHGPEIPGNGMGLALARRIVEGLGGRIWVESKVDSGSTFFLTVPLEPPVNVLPENPPAAASTA
jgi:light-regulated signal transduction histidine kinase (bacteriophytochrome)